MGIQELPENYESWLQHRQQHLKTDLAKSSYTIDLYRQYRRHLGLVRHWLLLQVQELVCPPRVKELLGLKANPVIPPAMLAYKFSRLIKADELIKAVFLPTQYKQEIKALDKN